MDKLARLAEVTRANQVESLHWGAVAVVNSQGELLYQAGDGHYFTFTRSALKPFQALPLVQEGGLEQFGFTLPQTALLCASHSGQPMHVAQVQAMLEKIGCSETDLRCGCHVPIAQMQSHEVASGPQAYTQLHNNCSGKHAGFLAYCVWHGLPRETYIEPHHPLQLAVQRSVASVCEMAPSELAMGIDGCSAPNYAMPLSRLAYAYARLAQGAAATGDYGASLEKLFQAMTCHPEMVAGTGRFDLALMQAYGSDVVAKGGAEGVQAIGLRSAGIGIAIKVADGNARALYPAVLAVLAQLGVLSEAVAKELESWARPQLLNVRGMQTGEIRACVQLHPV